MENPSTRKSSNGALEANILALLDSAACNQARDFHDDRHSFLEAVRSAYIISECANVPARKVSDAVFQIFKDSMCIELKMVSYHILCELDKRFPRVYVAHLDKTESCGTFDLVAVEEAWSPFVIGLEVAYHDKEATSRNSHGSIDSNGFFLLTQDICLSITEMNNSSSDGKLLGNMLLFQYLISVLDGDFVPRHTAYKETGNWAFLKDSLLHMLLGSRRINFKMLVKSCFSVLLERSHQQVGTSYDLKHDANFSVRTVDECDVAHAIAMPELHRGMRLSVQKFFSLILELDLIKKEADKLGLTSRADGSRTPLLEIILDELTYNKDLLSPFLQGFSDPKWKLEVVFQFFWKYCAKPSTRTRSSVSSSSDSSFDTLLKCFSNGMAARNAVKKISAEISQLLLAHAFQAYLSLHALKHTSDLDRYLGSCPLTQICKDLISAYNNIKDVSRKMEIMPFEKEAMFTAATILSART